MKLVIATQTVLNTDMSKLDFYFDIISPYAYLAWQSLQGMPEFQRCELELKPVLLGGILRSNQNLGPAEIPNKRQWVYRDVLRTARILELDFRFPPRHPFRSLEAMRALTAVALKQPEELLTCTQHFFDASWRHGRDMSDWDTILSVLESCGIELDAAECQSPEVKDELRRSSDAAVEIGIFGVPTVVYQGELFWGHDRLGHLAYCLQHGDILSNKDMQDLKQIPSGLE